MTAKKADREKLSSIAPFGLRMLPEMRQRVSEAAEDNGRSMNSEIVARLQATFDSEDMKDEGQQERDELWREIHRRDARIRQVETEAYERTKAIEEINAHLRAIVAQKDVIIKVVCYEVMSQGDRIMPRTFELASDMVKALGGVSELTDKDLDLAAKLMLSNLRRFFENKAIQAALSASRDVDGRTQKAEPKLLSGVDDTPRWDWENAQADPPPPMPKAKSGQAKRQKR